MTFVKVDGELPNKRRRGWILSLLEEFMNMNVKTVKVEFREGEYASAGSCQSSFYRSAKRGCFPVDVRIHNGEVYLVRRDM